ncbi:SRPBCC domain-containing protein [Cyclobacterium amurskyense]|uniref:ATPase n=1 Tax=Cyclobacterium amurskyense TaxID=320787 RepID=A0A0H4PCP0_9BACT|nr:SRPBCC domain-containing protein [Cyclobacterium amurskyense]AKP50905.1 ATPase [Cyclobacterium amurskyense]
MNPNLKFDFIVNKENNTVNIEREFAANLELVWEAWTNPEILDLWWAPKPYKTRTKSMDFREGGLWLYEMFNAESKNPQECHWCKNDYIKIAHQKMFSGLDAFCDEYGVINQAMPRTQWTNEFNENGEKTLVTITAKYESLSDLEKIIQMGFKEGFTMAMENLDQYIEAQFKLRKQNKSNNMARVSTYVNFQGNTEEAFNFYKSVFKTDFINGIKRFDEVPADSNQPPMAESVKKMVLHVELPIVGGHILMGTDAPKEMGFTLTKGNNMHINLEPDSREEAKRLFDALSEGGQIEMPIEDTFWGAYYGSFTDKFGINWMINYQNKE